MCLILNGIIFNSYTAPSYHKPQTKTNCHDLHFPFKILSSFVKKVIVIIFDVYTRKFIKIKLKEPNKVNN